MSKRYSMFISILFCAVLGFFVVWNLLTPDRDFSPNENTYLQQKPKFSLERVFKGTYMSEYEEYVTDQFAGRDGWIGLKAVSERILGKTENNGVYFGTDGKTLIAHFAQPDPTLVSNNLNYVNKLAENTGVPVYFSLIPGKDAVWADRLPANAPVGDQWALLEQAESACNTWMMQALAQAEYTGAPRWIDVSAPLLAHANDEDPAVFYRLDHHWTSYGAYLGYTALMAGMGLEATPLDAYTRTTVSTEFNGTTYSSAGVRWLESDAIDVYVPEEGVYVYSYSDMDENGNPIPEDGELYVDSFLEVKDKYSMFLGGNQPLCVIQTGAEGPKLLLVRDSFSDSLAPFLTANFSEIHLVDPRYYRVSLPGYIQANGIDEVLVLYSVANFVTDTNLFVLSMS